MNQQQANRLRTIVQENYQQIAQQFANTRQQPFWPKLRQLLQQLPLSGHLLDVGCGNGRLLDELIDRPITNYTGLDSSSELLNIASQKYANQSINKSINWQLGDILKTSINNQFDIVCCIATLHHIPSKLYRQQAAKQLANWLKPGGYLIISVWDLWRQPKYWPQLLSSSWASLLGSRDLGDLLFYWHNHSQPGYRRYYHAFTKQELKRLISSTGLKIIKYDNDSLNHYLVAQKLIDN